jgi:hypothetical protein
MIFFEILSSPFKFRLREPTGHIYAESPGERGAHLLGTEILAFYSLVLTTSRVSFGQLMDAAAHSTFHAEIILDILRKPTFTPIVTKISPSSVRSERTQRASNYRLF